MTTPAPPPGYRQTRLIDPFEIHVGPVFEKGEGQARHYAFRVQAHHVNLGGRLHGGMLMTFADLTLGQAVWDATGNAPCVTLNMQTQFLNAAREGDLVEVQPAITRQGRSLIFARGDFSVAGEVIFMASSVWKLLGQN
ncbi:MAG: PaaI family thioesterase [Alphaproteobacteria bacterium]|nr:PaaI family thioesterase [Alphaproteobacteria bacterium]MBU6471448.1 PaaI family thioesterase [Alphaproteobacteria bacterium]MDE2011883.1 PaaI family thioesterase [Alphaproteobacteria bacterium]